MFKLRWYILAGILSYLVFIAMTFPVQFLFEQVKEKTRGTPVEILAIDGSLFSGQSSLKVDVGPRKLPVKADWSISPFSLLLGNLGLELKMQGDQFQLDSDVALGMSTLSLSHVNGFVSDELINQFIKPQGAEIDGKVELKDVSLKMNYKDRVAEKASGELYWAGGEVVYRQGRRGQAIEMPPIKGVFASGEEGNLDFIVMEAKQGLTMGKVSVEPTGWAKISVFKRALQVAGQMKNVPDPNKTIFEVKQKIF